jgi:nucleotide sugar dehydrogenase
MEQSRQQRIAVVGSGYVGTVVAASLAFVGHQVVALEMDDARVASLSRGDVPFYERDLEELVRAGLAGRRLRFTSDAADAIGSSDIVFLCVGTPPAPDGHVDTSALAAAAREIAAVLDAPKVIVTKSTVPIGSGHWLRTTIEDAMGSGARAQFAVVSNPEFLRQGSAVDDYLHPDRVVIGSDDPEALERLVDLYRPILDQSFEGGRPSNRPALVRTNLSAAETVKYASNAFLALKISFVNELANICELVGADILDVTRALGLDPRIGPRFLDAGIGWGGSCFGKDLGELIATAAEHDYDAQLLRATREVNCRQRAVVVRKLRSRLHGLRGQRIGLLGLAFKPGTDDLRDAPAVDIARALVDGGAVVVAHDPLVRRVHDLDVRVVDDPYEVGERADAVVLVTEWPEYRSLELNALRERMRGRLFVDGRNLFDPDKVAACGLVYEGVGGRSLTAEGRVAL